MENFEKEIMVRHILNKIWIEKAMHLGDPEDVKKNSTPPKNMKGNKGVHLIVGNTTSSK